MDDFGGPFLTYSGSLSYVLGTMVWRIPRKSRQHPALRFRHILKGVLITPEDMERCLEYWRDNISETGDPRGRRRAVCCEPFSIPCCTCHRFYKFTHPERKMPYDEDDERNTPELREVSMFHAFANMVVL